MKNLLEETKNFLKVCRKSLYDIEWVANKGRRITVERFIELANVEYDNDFGYTEVAEDLIIVGDDWWLERHEYDGYEWWEYKTFPTPTSRKTGLNSFNGIKEELS